MLKNVYGLIKDHGYEVINLDCSLLLQKPKIAKYVPEMRRIIAGLIETGEDRVSVKATTTEKLGFVGREEGAAAMASVLIKKKGD
ncbi:MAG TPA: 2-C-methyl-D-erythritol 2,4-cyclodiphosphate synthase [Ignavibacteriales bacterium]|nr:2-C-methyl-D-erythritol 2,4-cyclodiphosphate synthase [Ignavibacteriales bacterium]